MCNPFKGSIKQEHILSAGPTVYSTFPPHYAQMSSLYLKVYCVEKRERGEKSQSEDPWFHLQGPWVKKSFKVQPLSRTPCPHPLQFGHYNIFIIFSYLECYETNFEYELLESMGAWAPYF